MNVKTVNWIKVPILSQANIFPSLTIARMTEVLGSNFPRFLRGLYIILFRMKDDRINE